MRKKKILIKNFILFLLSYFAGKFVMDKVQYYFDIEFGWYMVFIYMFPVYFILLFLIDNAFFYIKKLISKPKEDANARLVLSNLANSGVLELNLADLKDIWSDKGEVEKNEEEEIEIDMSKMYHFWRDDTAIEIHNQQQKGFKQETISIFFDFLKEKLKVDEKLGMSDSENTPERSRFQALYRIILFLLQQLDEFGQCPSVVVPQKENVASYRSDEPDNNKIKLPVELPTTLLTKYSKYLKPEKETQENSGGNDGDKKNKDEGRTILDDIKASFRNTYEILRDVSLENHTIRVTKNIIKLLEEREKDQAYKEIMMPVAVIVALAHDIGKIPAFYNSAVYNKMTHPLISAKILEDFIENYNANLRNSLDETIINIMVETVKNHHAVINPKSTSDIGVKKMLEYLKKADRKAREEEVRRKIEAVLEEMGITENLQNQTKPKEKNTDYKPINEKDINDAMEDSKRINQELDNSQDEQDKDGGSDSEEKETGENLQPPQKEEESQGLKTNDQSQTTQDETNPTKQNVSPQAKPTIANSMQAVEALRGRLKERKFSQKPTPQNQTTLTFKYPDFERYLRIKPTDVGQRSEDGEFYGDKLLDQVEGWVKDGEAISIGLQIIEERINTCKVIRDKKTGQNRVISGFFSVRDTAFVLASNFMSIIFYIGDKFYNDKVYEKPASLRQAYAVEYIDAFKREGFIKKNEIKEGYFSALFYFVLTDYDGKETLTRPAKYVPFDLGAIAALFEKSMEEYEERKKNPLYCPEKYLLKFTDYKWGKDSPEE